MEDTTTTIDDTIEGQTDLTNTEENPEENPEEKPNKGGEDLIPRYRLNEVTEKWHAAQQSADEYNQFLERVKDNSEYAGVKREIQKLMGISVSEPLSEIPVEEMIPEGIDVETDPYWRKITELSKTVTEQNQRLSKLNEEIGTRRANEVAQQFDRETTQAIAEAKKVGLTVTQVELENQMREANVYSPMVALEILKGRRLPDIQKNMELKLRREIAAKGGSGGLPISGTPSKLPSGQPKTIEESDERFRIRMAQSIYT